jgi:uncharacterized membrane protein
VFSSIDFVDIFAFVWFLATAVGYQIVTKLPSLYPRSITGAIQSHRIAWMRTMALRDNRNSDALLLGVLSNGNAFFASTCAIAIGGLAAIVGSHEKSDGLIERLPSIAKASPLLLEVKVLLLIGVFVYAFFKFAWAFRLTHYTAILIGAMPLPGACEPDLLERHAMNTAALNGLAAEHSNSGLRAFYYAAAALTWFFSPAVFIAATTAVLAILLRRDFFSRSRRIIAGQPV